MQHQSDLQKLACDESRLTIRQGGINGQPYWNTNAQVFKYAPAFDIPEMENVSGYRYVIQDALGKKHAFTADTPHESLAAIWTDIAPGRCILTVEGLQCGYAIGFAGSRGFIKTAPFTGNYPPAARPYGEAARLAMKNLLENPYTQYWKTTGKPHPDYPLYCYPAKIYSALIEGMCLLAELSPEHKQEALTIAQITADFLISISAPAGQPLEYMPPTYYGTNLTAQKYAGQNMMVYPCAAGLAYLKLFRETAGKTYLDAARHIGDTYLKTQLPNGSWYLKIDEKTGKNTVENYAAEPDIADFLWQLADATANDAYAKAAERMMNYLHSTLTTSFNWEGQFEDVHPTPPYRNLAQHQAASLLILDLKRGNKSQKSIETDREILRYCEDQFIFWEPADIGDKNWKYPSVVEQFAYYVPVDASAAKMIRTFLAMYKTDPARNMLDLAKARALGDAITRFQNPTTGRIPTLWFDDFTPDTDWTNCTVFSATALAELAEIEKK